MKLTQIHIHNFRSLKDIKLPLAGTTVLLGENNVGKSAVLDAIRHVLSRASTRRTSPFEEYDFHVADEQANPRTSPGILIDALFQESRPDEWPDNVRDALRNVIQLDPIAGTCSIHLRLSARFDPSVKNFVSNLEFLTLDGSRLRGNHTINLNELLRYVPLFRLSAVRDPGDELSGRSQFWRPILKSLDLPEDQVEEIQRQMEQLNQRLLQLDDRLNRVTATLGRAGDVVSTGTGDRVLIRALPLKAWDLMARSDIVVRGSGSNVAFPLLRHGQGLQSLAVLFLFEAFVEHLLAISYEPESTPLLTLEEPEAHLHPQAARTLWHKVKELPGQQIITTHSPYFAQLVPIHDIRILRRRGPETTVHWLPRTAEVKVPSTPELEQLISMRPDLYEYRASEGSLIARRPLTEDERRELLTVYSSDRSMHPQISELRRRASVLLVESDLHDIEQYVRRTRGEILFARCWLLCEGQSEAILLPRFAEIMGISLDALGISLIDYQNNGSPGAFAALARALDIPWFMLCDKDQGGDDHIKQVKDRGFPEDELNDRIRQLPDTDLEGLLASRFTAKLREIAMNKLDARFERGLDDPGFAAKELAPFLKQQHKTKTAMLLAEALSDTDADLVPEPIKSILTRCKEIADG